MHTLPRNIVLVVGARFDPPCDKVILTLADRGVDVVRVHPEDFPTRARLSAWLDGGQISGRLELAEGGRVLDLGRVYSAYMSHPQPPRPLSELPAADRGFAREETTAALRGLWRLVGNEVLWVSAPHAIRAAECKPYQLGLAALLGLHTPRTLITNCPGDARDFFDACGGEVIYKPIDTRSVESWAPDPAPLVQYTNRVSAEHLQFLEDVRMAPCLFQEYVPKHVEIRATVVGDAVFAAEIHSQENPGTLVDWRRMPIGNPLLHLPHELPGEVAAACANLVADLELRYGAIDLVLTPDGEYVFLEINPVGQWVWIQELTGLPICEAICDLLQPQAGGWSRTARSPLAPDPTRHVA